MNSSFAGALFVSLLLAYVNATSEPQCDEDTKIWAYVKCNNDSSEWVTMEQLLDDCDNGKMREDKMVHNINWGKEPYWRCAFEVMNLWTYLDSEGNSSGWVTTEQLVNAYNDGKMGEEKRRQRVKEIRKCWWTHKTKRDISYKERTLPAGSVVRRVSGTANTWTDEYNKQIELGTDEVTELSEWQSLWQEVPAGAMVRGKKNERAYYWNIITNETEFVKPEVGAYIEAIKGTNFNWRYSQGWKGTLTKYDTEKDKWSVTWQVKKSGRPVKNNKQNDTISENHFKVLRAAPTRRRLITMTQNGMI